MKYPRAALWAAIIDGAVSSKGESPARAVGVSFSRWSNYVAGRRPLPLETWHRAICLIGGRELDLFWDDVTAMANAMDELREAREHLAEHGEHMPDADRIRRECHLYTDDWFIDRARRLHNPNVGWDEWAKLRKILYEQITPWNIRCR